MLESYLSGRRTTALFMTIQVLRPECNRQIVLASVTEVLTINDLADRLKHLLAYIEEHLPASISLEMLESASGLSRFQIIRLFKRLCGYSPADYIKCRKLSNSIADLYAGRKIIDIALDHGFEYEQSYIRAFRSVYGISPARLRRTNKEVKLLEPLQLGGLQVYSDRFVGEPQLKHFSGLVFNGEELFYNYKDNNVRGQPLIDGAVRMTAGIFTGICIPHGSGTFTHKYIRCMADNPGNNVTYALPAGKYAVFHYTGLHPLDKTGAHKIRTLMYIVIGAWAAENGVIWDENFVERMDKDALGDDYCEIQVAVPCRSVNR